MKTIGKVVAALAIGLFLAARSSVLAQASEPVTGSAPVQLVAPAAVVAPVEPVSTSAAPAVDTTSSAAVITAPAVTAAVTVTTTVTVAAANGAVSAPVTPPAATGTAVAAKSAPGTELIELGAESQLPPGVDVSKSEQGSELVTITLDNVPLQDVIRMFTRISGANIVAGTNLQGNVTVSLQNVEWKPAMNVILDSVNMALVEKSPGIYSVLSKAELASEPVTMDTVYLRFVTVSNIVPVVQKMLVSTNAQVAGFPAANAVVVQETAARLAVIKDIINRIDKPRPQVFIEAKFVELNEDAIKDLGVNWQVLQGYTVGLQAPTLAYTRDNKTIRQSQNNNNAFNTTDNLQSHKDDNLNQQQNIVIDSSVSANNNNSSVLGLVPNPPTINYGSGGVSGQLSGHNISAYDPLTGNMTPVPAVNQNHTIEDLTQNSTESGNNSSQANQDNTTKTAEQLLTTVLSAQDFALTISALKQTTGAEVVSDPRIVVASGETARIHVGRNQPNVTALPQGDNVARYAYALNSAQPFIEIGVKISVTPTVNTESNITVRIEPELSRLFGQETVGEAGMSFPITDVNQIITEFNLESGRTVAIGGLTSSEDTENVIKVPVLGDIPIIGKYLFTYTHTEKLQSEVIIFVTVGLARPETLNLNAGIPSEGKLIHRHLAREASANGEAISETPQSSQKPENK